MADIRTSAVTSADGTVIVFDQSGTGLAVVLVGGALNDRADPVMSGLAAGLSGRFTVFSYDRRAAATAATRSRTRSSGRPRTWPRSSRRPAMAAAAGSLAYEARVMGPGNVLPAGLLAGVTQPALVLNGGASPAWMRRAGQAVADAMPTAVHRVLEGQAHAVAPAAIVAPLLEFLGPS